jgi:hypothetical protein
MFSQGSDYSEITGSEDASSVALKTIQQRGWTQEMELADNETAGENSASERSKSENLSSESPEIANSKNSASNCLQKNSDTSSEAGNANLHNPLSSCGTMPRMIAYSLETMKHSETRTCSTAKEQIRFTPSRRDPRLQSASYANYLFGTKTSLTSYICDTDTQSTYFSGEPDLHTRSSKQIESVSHATVHAKFTIQTEEPANNILVNINSNDTNHMQSADTSNNQNTSDLRQNEKGLNMNSKQAKSNSERTAYVNENINVLSKNPNSQSILNQTKTSDLPHLTGSMCMHTSDTSKKQSTNLSATSGEKLIMNIQSSTQPPDDMCFKTLQVINTTDEHINQNVRETESSTVMKNCDETTATNINIKKHTEISHNSLKNQTKHKVESRTKLMSNKNGQPVKNASQLSITSINEKQMENFQQSLSDPQEFTAESQRSDRFGLTQSLLTQSEQGSFIFGIKRIWSHSASEFIPNYQLPEGFWTNKATPVPKDLLQTLENW